MSIFYQILCLAVSFVTAFPSRSFVDSVVTLNSTGRCPQGRQLSKRECRYLPNNDAFATWIGEGGTWIHETCGCYINANGKRKFNHFEGSCDNPDLGQKMICKEHNPMDTCNDHTRIDGSFGLSCDQDNTYACDDEGRATDEGTHCCCENGFEPNEDGYCVACDLNKKCEPSQEWKRVCEDCICEKYDNLGDMTIEACKSEAEIRGYDYISIRDNNARKNCRGSYKRWCNGAERKEDESNSARGWDTHKLTIENCFGNETTVWSNMKGFDSVCDKTEYSIDIRVDLRFYDTHDDEYSSWHGEDCKSLCESVGSVCLGGWAHWRHKCPSSAIRNNIGCTARNRDARGRKAFVCSCAAITNSGFVLIDGNPQNGNDPKEFFNPDPYQDIGDVQCCHPSGQCTRKNPWNSGSNSDCMSGINDDDKYSLHEAISMCRDLGDDWSLCTREESDGMCGGKGCGIDFQLVWAWDPNMIQASKVINYDDCTTIHSKTGPPHGASPEDWETKCPENTAVVSVETMETSLRGQHWNIAKMQCCPLVDKITVSQYRIPEVVPPYLQGGGSSSVEDQWEAQCPPNAVMVGIYDNDDNGDLDDIDATACNTLDCPYTCGEKIDNDDCVVVNISPYSLSSCPIDYVMVGLWDAAGTYFSRVRKMKCCRVLESIPPTVSPTQMPTTDDPSQCPTASPTTSIPSMSPTTDEPTLYPSQNPTTEQPTDAPSLTPSTEEPSISPSRCPTSSDPTYYPSKSPSKSPTTDSPTLLPTISPSTDQPTKFPSTSPTTEEPSLFPTMPPSTDSPTKSPSQNPTTEEPTAFPTTEEPSLFPTTPPSTDSPTKSPSQNPTTEEPTAFPSTPPTYAPTLCEPTCRSHADQMVNFLDLMLDFNTVLLESVEFRKSDEPLQIALDEMILRLRRLKDHMNIMHDDVMPFIPPVH